MQIRDIVLVVRAPSGQLAGAAARAVCAGGIPILDPGSIGLALARGKLC